MGFSDPLFSILTLSKYDNDPNSELISILVCRNQLKLNHDKTEIMLILSMYRTRPPVSDFIMGNARLRTTANKAWE